MKRSLWIGYDPRESDAFAVAAESAAKQASGGLMIESLVLFRLCAKGLYRRPTATLNGNLWDTISGAPMATEFAISRFLVPHLAGKEGWALFVDGDVMFRRDPLQLFDLCDDKFAVMCVKRTHMPTDEAMVAAYDQGRPVATSMKMDGQVQTFYARKNWSSVMLFNLAHPANARLTVEMANTLPGRDLHRFCWLNDDEIGALPGEWNHLVGVDPPRPDAALVHFTLGVPSMRGYEASEYAVEWRAWLRRSSFKNQAVGGVQ